MKTLVFGSNGQLGQALLATAPAEFDLVGVDRAELDITDADRVLKACREIRPAVIINAAGYTAVDEAESHSDLARAANVDGPRNIAMAARDVNARLIHISTDFVFDGEAVEPYRTDSATNPLSIYGRTKRDSETAVLGALPTTAAVVRTAWLYSKTGGNFVKTMLRLMGERDELSVVADQRGTPTWADSLAEAVWALVEVREFHGTYHWTDAGECTWHEFAVAIQEEALALGLLDRAIPIHPIASEDYPTAALRPQYGVLDCSSTVDLLGLQPEPWRVNLRRMLKGLQT
jgi:dTDP-4-dehydrorhamnose reductase